MSQVDKFWTHVNQVYAAWSQNGSWGDVLIAVPGKPAEEGVPCTIDALFEGLFDAFMSQTPLYFKKSGQIGIFTSSAQAIEIIQPMVNSCPKTIGSTTFTFSIHPKNRKDPLVDAKLLSDSLGGAKGVGWIYEKDLLNGYSTEFVAALNSFVASSGLTSANVNGPIAAALKTKAPAAQESDDDSEDDSVPVSNALSQRRQRARTVQTSQYSREQDRKNRNKQLSQQLNDAALKRLQEDDSIANSLKDPAQRVHTSYGSFRDMPSDLSPKEISIDASRDTILFPVNCQLLPVHISCVKNVTQIQQGEFNIVTVEFVTPTAKKLPPGSDVEHTFLRSLQYRSKGGALSEIFTRIRQMQTDFKAKLKAQASTAQLVEQPKLVSLKNPSVVLRDVSSKPLISPAKGAKGRAVGVLTAHSNGFKYIVADKQQGAFSVEFIYSNIKSAFFKRAGKTDNLILLHFEFHHPILVKKDKTSKFMQFYIELVEESYDTSKGAGMNEREAEMIEEEQERKMAKQRRAWNDRFAEFATGVEKQVETNNPDLELSFEMSDRAMKFQGIVNKDQVDVYPTTEGQNIIGLEATPIPFVVAVADIEVVALERVGFGLREFDMVVVFKDLKQEPRMISSIPYEQIDIVRTILENHSLLYFETKMNTQWKAFLEEIRKDILAFYEDGGWNSFVIDTDDEDEDDDEDDEDEDDEDYDEDGGKRKKNKAKYADSDSDFEMDSDASDSDDDYSSDEDEDDESDDFSESSEGEDWSDMEDEAEEEDRRSEKKSSRGRDDDDRKSSKKDKKSDKKRR